MELYIFHSYVPFNLQSFVFAFFLLIYIFLIYYLLFLRFTAHFFQEL